MVLPPTSPLGGQPDERIEGVLSVDITQAQRAFNELLRTANSLTNALGGIGDAIRSSISSLRSEIQAATQELQNLQRTAQQVARTPVQPAGAQAARPFSQAVTPPPLGVRGTSRTFYDRLAQERPPMPEPPPLTPPRAGTPFVPRPENLRPSALRQMLFTGAEAAAGAPPPPSPSGGAAPLPGQPAGAPMQPMARPTMAAMSGFIGTIGLAAATQFATGGLQRAMGLEGLALQLKALSTSGGEMKRVMEETRKFAEETGQSYLSMLSGATSLLMLTRGRNVNFGKVLDIAGRLSIMDPVQGARGAAFALREFLAGETRSLAQRFEIPLTVLRQIKEESGGDPAKKIEMLSELLDQLGYTRDAVTALANTASAAMTRLNDEITQLQAQAFQPLLESFVTPFTRGLTQIVKTIREATPELQSFITMFAALGTGAIANFSLRSLMQVPGVNVALQGFGQAMGMITTPRRMEQLQLRAAAYADRILNQELLQFGLEALGGQAGVEARRAQLTQESLERRQRRFWNRGTGALLGTTAAGLGIGTYIGVNLMRAGVRYGWAENLSQEVRERAMRRVRDEIFPYIIGRTPEEFDKNLLDFVKENYDREFERSFKGARQAEEFLASMYYDEETSNELGERAKQVLFIAAQALAQVILSVVSVIEKLGIALGEFADRLQNFLGGKGWVSSAEMRASSELNLAEALGIKPEELSETVKQGQATTPEFTRDLATRIFEGYRFLVATPANRELAARDMLKRYAPDLMEQYDRLYQEIVKRDNGLTAEGSNQLVAKAIELVAERLREIAERGVRAGVAPTIEERFKAVDEAYGQRLNDVRKALLDLLRLETPQQKAARQEREAREKYEALRAGQYAHTPREEQQLTNDEQLEAFRKYKEALKAIEEQVKTVTESEKLRIETLEKQAAERRKEIIEGHKQAEAALINNYNEQRRKLVDQFHRDELKRQRDFQKAMERAARNHRLALMEAAAQLDAVAVMKELRRFNESKREATEQYNEETQLRRQAFEEMLGKMAQNLQIQLAAMQRDRDERLKALDELLAMERKASAERLDAVAKEAEERKRILNEKFREELIMLSDNEEAKLALMRQKQDESLKELEAYWRDVLRTMTKVMAEQRKQDEQKRIDVMRSEEARRLWARVSETRAAWLKARESGSIEEQIRAKEAHDAAQAAYWEYVNRKAPPTEPARVSTDALEEEGEMHLLPDRNYGTLRERTRRRLAELLEQFKEIDAVVNTFMSDTDFARRLSSEFGVPNLTPTKLIELLSNVNMQGDPAVARLALQDYLRQFVPPRTQQPQQPSTSPTQQPVEQPSAPPAQQPVQLSRDLLNELARLAVERTRTQRGAEVKGLNEFLVKLASSDQLGALAQALTGQAVEGREAQLAAVVNAIERLAENLAGSGGLGSLNSEDQVRYAVSVAQEMFSGLKNIGETVPVIESPSGRVVAHVTIGDKQANVRVLMPDDMVVVPIMDENNKVIGYMRSDKVRGETTPARLTYEGAVAGLTHLARSANAPDIAQQIQAMFGDEVKRIAELLQGTEFKGSVEEAIGVVVRYLQEISGVVATADRNAFDAAEIIRQAFPNLEKLKEEVTPVVEQTVGALGEFAGRGAELVGQLGALAARLLSQLLGINYEQALELVSKVVPQAQEFGKKATEAIVETTRSVGTAGAAAQGGATALANANIPQSAGNFFTQVVNTVSGVIQGVRNLINGINNAVRNNSNPSTNPQVNVQPGQTVITAYASGTAHVPRTGLYMLHQGEAVLSPIAAESVRSALGKNFSQADVVEMAQGRSGLQIGQFAPVINIGDVGGYSPSQIAALIRQGTAEALEAFVEEYLRT